MATNQNSKGQKKGTKLPSKQIVFGNQPTAKNSKAGNASVSTQKKGGVNLMRKLSGM